MAERGDKESAESRRSLSLKFERVSTAGFEACDSGRDYPLVSRPDVKLTDARCPRVGPV
jgi:hypothetical protein